LHDDSQFQLQFPNEVIDLMDNAHSGRWQWRELEVSTW
jgi:hypothetical protein